MFEKLNRCPHDRPNPCACLFNTGKSWSLCLTSRVWSLRQAQIPTGWEITLELIKKLALLENEECKPTPEEWFRTKFGIEPDYAKLLDSVAKMPSERRQLLSGYSSPLQTRPGRGCKTAYSRPPSHCLPCGWRLLTCDHHDQLRSANGTCFRGGFGITPTVISTVDQLKGSIPLVHSRCCLVKIHGDYLDTRIQKHSGRTGNLS